MNDADRDALERTGRAIRDAKLAAAQALALLDRLIPENSDD